MSKFTSIKFLKIYKIHKKVMIGHIYRNIIERNLNTQILTSFKKYKLHDIDYEVHDQL